MVGPDDSESLALQPKRAAVLTYLMVARQGPQHRRDTLLAMFWPEHDTDRGRNALSKVIHHLRRSLPVGAIVTQGDQIGVSRGKLWCDVTAFERALEGGRAEEALTLYRGELLQGFHISGSPDFDHWSDIERARLRRMAVASAWELASEAERAGDGARAIRFARQAVEWAPTDEPGFRRYLTLLHSRGNRPEALEAFETFERDLQRDYGVDPSGPTLELVEAIRDGSLPFDLTPPLLAGTEAKSPARTTESGEPTPAGDAVKQERLPTTSIGSVDRPPSDSRRRGKLVAGALATGLVGLVALSLLGPGRFSMGGDRGQAGSVLVTEFDDVTEAGLGAVVSDALRIDLAQSSALDLVERVDIIGTLERMGLESGVPISAEIGREVAVRDGLTAVVEGAVVPA
ncbi:MAG: AfsR/SARP family transcriptional regulator, partial [Longimicrobiales bacterium]